MRTNKRSLAAGLEENLALNEWIQQSASCNDRQKDRRSEEKEIARNVPRDPEAFQILFDRYYELILNYIYRRTLCRDVAEDLTSKTFIKAFEFLKKAEREVNMRPWLYRIATNVWLQHEKKKIHSLKNNKLLFSIKNFVSKQTPLSKLHDKENANNLRTLLVSLDPKYREPLLLKYDEEFTCEEISEILQITKENTRQRISRGLKMIRKKWQELEEGER